MSRYRNSLDIRDTMENIRRRENQLDDWERDLRSREDNLMRSKRDHVNYNHQRAQYDYHQRDCRLRDYGPHDHHKNNKRHRRTRDKDYSAMAVKREDDVTTKQNTEVNLIETSSLS